jgi:Ca2+-binding RTX toxin-like protein
VTGGSGILKFYASGSGADSLTAGSGDSTLFGGSGNDTLTGGSGNDMLAGGAGTNTYIGGTGNDTMNGAGSFTNLFQFANVAHGGAGTHVITNFVGSDTINILGVDSATVLADSTFNGTDTVISIDGGSVTITLKNFDLTSTHGHIGNGT